MKSVALLLLCLTYSYAAVPQTWQKFFIMMFENHGYNEVMSDPTWTSIIAKSFLLTNYHGVTHPSQPNYVAQIGGSYYTCTSDSNCNLPYKNLVDLFDPKMVTWRAYEENYTADASGACALSTEENMSYYRKHDPFMSFTDITTNLTRCQNIVNAQAYIGNDVKSNSLRDFSYYTPNIDDDSHDEPLSYSGQYLQNWMQSYYWPFVGVGQAWYNTLFMITFDEDEGTEGNHVVAFFFNPALTVGGLGNGSYNHYSVTKFVEQNWNLGNLGQNDVNATNFQQAFY
jgi:hypothetical protein